ncbi:hypothetical protein LMG27952_05084 [Paraburkholderia hiiakae]|uniref:Uncharacterized protein n=1 Tax=Paraburkholderia hiiakae TaxID=1081782 RepID=A0ABM8NZK7_9BURK|nr:hypothetical protein [Paraburkholderia hiiakae]CAD6550872.1 hypothetical protein LMG27952_05084 [Paraburkholderia hiiakae]
MRRETPGCAGGDFPIEGEVNTAQQTELLCHELECRSLACAGKALTSRSAAQSAASITACYSAVGIKLFFTQYQTSCAIAPGDVELLILT